MRRADERHGAALLAFFVAALLGAAVLVAALTSCARPPVAEVVRELDAGSVTPPAGDPCDCSFALDACAPSGYACGVGASCADGVPYRSVDGGGVALVSRACPVPVLERGRVVALCLDGHACDVGDDGGGVVAR